jgi:hypothetical protein
VLAIAQRQRNVMYFARFYPGSGRLSGLRNKFIASPLSSRTFLNSELNESISISTSKVYTLLLTWDYA